MEQNELVWNEGDSTGIHITYTITQNIAFNETNSGSCNSFEKGHMNILFDFLVGLATSMVRVPIGVGLGLAFEMLAGGAATVRIYDLELAMVAATVNGTGSISSTTSERVTSAADVSGAELAEVPVEVAG